MMVRKLDGRLWVVTLTAALALFADLWKGVSLVASQDVSPVGRPVCFSKPEHFWGNTTTPLNISSNRHYLSAGPSIRSVCPRHLNTQFSKCPKGTPLRLIEIFSDSCRMARVSPELFAEAMQGRTLWLWGDSMMNSLYETVLQCSEKPDEPPAENAGGTDQMNYKWAHIENIAVYFRPSQKSTPKSNNCIYVKCVQLQSGADVCFMRNNKDSIAAEDGSVPCLDGVEPRDVVLVNAGTGVKMTDAAQQGWRGGAVQSFIDWKVKRDMSGQPSPTLIWREFFSQHFQGVGGHYVSREHAKRGCVRKADPKVMAQHNHRNAGLNEMLEAAGIPVFPVHGLSAPLSRLHPGHGDCTHWCQYAGDVLEDVWNMLQLYVIGLVAPEHLKGL